MGKQPCGVRPPDARAGGQRLGITRAIYPTRSALFFQSFHMQFLSRQPTRRRIPESAFAEFYKNGFQGGSLNHILPCVGETHSPPWAVPRDERGSTAVVALIIASRAPRSRESTERALCSIQPTHRPGRIPTDPTMGSINCRAPTSTRRGCRSLGRYQEEEPDQDRQAHERWPRGAKVRVWS